MTESDRADGAEAYRPLDHPEIERLFDELTQTLIGESDRGAVLVGAAYVDQHLRTLFETVFPDGLGRKRRKALLNYPGPASVLSARADLAYALRLVPKDLHASIHALRKLRNDVAHGPHTFSLLDHRDRLSAIFDFGQDLPAGVRATALHLLLEYKAQVVFDSMAKLVDEDPGIESAAIQTKAELAAHLEKHPELVDALERQLPQWELTIGLSILCGMIVFHRDSAAKVLGEARLVGDLAVSYSE